MWTPSASAETTVRQTPLTASESPGVSVGDSSVLSRRRKPAGRRLDLGDLADRFNRVR